MSSTVMFSLAEHDTVKYFFAITLWEITLLSLFVDFFKNKDILLHSNIFYKDFAIEEKQNLGEEYGFY